MSSGHRQALSSAPAADLARGERHPFRSGSTVGRAVGNAEASAQSPQVAAATPSGKATENLIIQAPHAAPTNISTTDATRLLHPALLPSASVESAAIPVTVRVSTVVVRSRTA